MSLSLDLLEQAQHLASREKKKPKQASLRRSVSTAYYALFHLLTGDASATIAPNVSEAATNRIKRWFEHGHMKSACGVFRSTSLPNPIQTLIGSPTVPPDLQLVARAFIQLQEARHSADYDMSSVWTRLTAEQNIQISRDAFNAWNRVRKSAAANIFLLGLLDLKRVQTERT